MVAVNSTMLALGTEMPHFALTDITTGKEFSSDTLPHSPAYWIMFICNHCPYVVHIKEKLAQLTTEYKSKGVSILAINSNDAEAYPADSPEKMKEEVSKSHYSFPYLWDESQTVAKNFKAACTPDFFIFDHHKKLAYRGQFDDSRPSNGKPVTGLDIKTALDKIISGQSISESDQKPSIGCNIKWKKGQEPQYFRF